jgi:hypothetical protein
MKEKPDAQPSGKPPNRIIAGIVASIAGSLSVLFISSLVSRYTSELALSLELGRDSASRHIASESKLEAFGESINGLRNQVSSYREEAEKRSDSIERKVEINALSLDSGERYTEEDAARREQTEAEITSGLRRDIERLYGICLKE